MSRIAVVLLVAASLSMAPGLALGAGEQERDNQTSAAQSEEARSCAIGSEAAPSGEACYCPAQNQAARSETPEAQEMPVYVPPNRGSLSTRIGGASRGGAQPVRDLARASPA
jgi:hypothetical protein